MILGELKNWNLIPNSKRFQEAFKFLEKNIEDLPTGKHFINDKIYAVVIKTKSRSISSGEFEAHKKYIDLQYLISGKEIIGISNINRLKISKNYDEENDATLYKIPEDYERIELGPRMFVILFPEDGHMPSCHLDKEREIHKVVVKVSLD